MKLNKNVNTEQRDEFPLLKPGEYDFEVENAIHKKSSSGNDMWEVELKFEQPNGPDTKVWEYFVEVEEEWANKKFVSFFNCIGVSFEDSEEMPKAIGEIGKAKIKIEKGKDGYADKNKVSYWIPKKSEKAESTSSGDGLPF